MGLCEDSQVQSRQRKSLFASVHGFGCANHAQELVGVLHVEIILALVGDWTMIGCMPGECLTLPPRHTPSPSPGSGPEIVDSSSITISRVRF